ncbi:MAG: hypothetical protein KDK66_09270, partial [Deltaproteobacteria bacterium]|nr:hypothetical protein [Deltaproteobacteria bacterium]
MARVPGKFEPNLSPDRAVTVGIAGFPNKDQASNRYVDGVGALLGSAQSHGNPTFSLGPDKIEGHSWKLNTKENFDKTYETAQRFYGDSTGENTLYHWYFGHGSKEFNYQLSNGVYFDHQALSEAIKDFDKVFIGALTCFGGGNHENDLLDSGSVMGAFYAAYDDEAIDAKPWAHAWAKYSDPKNTKLCDRNGNRRLEVHESYACTVESFQGLSSSMSLFFNDRVPLAWDGDHSKAVAPHHYQLRTGQVLTPETIELQDLQQLERIRKTLRPGEMIMALVHDPSEEPGSSMIEKFEKYIHAQGMFLPVKLSVTQAERQALGIPGVVSLPAFFMMDERGILNRAREISDPQKLHSDYVYSRAYSVAERAEVLQGLLVSSSPKDRKQAWKWLYNARDPELWRELAQLIDLGDWLKNEKDKEVLKYANDHIYWVLDHLIEDQSIDLAPAYFAAINQESWLTKSIHKLKLNTDEKKAEFLSGILSIQRKNPHELAAYKAMLPFIRLWSESDNPKLAKLADAVLFELSFTFEEIKQLNEEALGKK